MAASDHTGLLSSLALQCKVPESLIEDAFPCTPFQSTCIRASAQALRFQHTTFVFELDDSIRANIPLLKRCWEYACIRNSILRTRIAKIEKSDAEASFIQVVLKEDIRWTTVKDIKAYQREAAQFDRLLDPGDPLIYFAVTEACKHFALTIHHAIYDAWSLGLVWGDVQAAWNSGGNQKAPVPRPPFNRYIAYLQRLGQAKPPAICSPEKRSYERPNLSKQRNQSANQQPSDGWPNAVLDQQGDLPFPGSLNESVRITTLVKAAWACVLMEAFNKRDIIFPDYYAGRSCPVSGVEQMTGPTICAFPRRISLTQRSTLPRFLQDVQDASDEILKHEHWGYLSPNTQGYGEKDGQYCLNVINLQANDLDGVKHHIKGMTPIPALKFSRGKWDCIMVVTLQKQTVNWKLFADKSRFERGQIELVGNRYSQVIESFANNSSDESKRVCDLVRI